VADAKWIPDLHGKTPLAEAARTVLTLRLHVVRERLPLAAAHADEDEEHVHQLRVGTRRAGAALRIFASVVPERLYRKTRKTLRRIRRAAGAARDWDVFLQALTARMARAAPAQSSGLHFLVGYADGQRAAAQGELAEVARKKSKRVSALLEDLAAALDERSDDGQTLGELAVPVLTDLLHDLEEAAHGDLAAYEHLHQVRIFGKHLRYAMEVFESCFAAAFRAQFYPEIAAMQEILGRANDSHVAVSRLTELRTHLLRAQPEQWPAYRPGIESLLRFHQRRLPQQRRAFQKWWRAWQNSGAEKAFAALIRRGE
jgi:CHAD domain-containing protein